MKIHGARGDVSKLAVVALFVVVAFAGIFSLSILDILPFLKIKQIRFSVKNPHLATLVKNVIKKEAENNILFLKLKKDLITELLRKKSKYKIEDFYIKDVDWSSGKVYLKIIENTPLALLNDKFCISTNGRIYADKSCNYLKVNDRTSAWRLGNFYTPLKEIKAILSILPAKEIIINNQLIKVYGKNIQLTTNNIVKLNIGLTAYEKIEKTFSPQRVSTVINLLGKKAYYIKIIKGRTDE